MNPLGLRPPDGRSRSKTRDDREASLPAGARRWLSGLSFGILAVYGPFFLLSWNRSGPKDGDQFLVFHTLQYWNSSMFGIAKQWTPLLCSGLSMAGEPQVPCISLSMALSYVLGPLDGVKSAHERTRPFMMTRPTRYLRHAYSTWSPLRRISFCRLPPEGYTSDRAGFPYPCGERSVSSSIGIRLRSLGDGFRRWREQLFGRLQSRYEPGMGTQA
jgi:hypothetical protein